MPDLDSFNLPPVQSLIMENLGARRRLGERCWHFDTKNRKAVQALADLGLVTFKSGSVEHTLQVWLTDKGAEHVLNPTYTAPLIRELEYIRDELADVVEQVKNRPFCPHHDKGDPLCLAAASKRLEERQ